HPGEQRALGGEEDARVLQVRHRYQLACARWPIAREIFSAVSFTIPDHAGLIRSAGAETESPATTPPESSRMAAPMQRTPSSASSLSTAYPCRRTRSSSRSRAGTESVECFLDGGSPRRIGLDALRPIIEQEELPGGGDVKRRSRADDVYDADQRPPARGALDVDDLVVAPDREVDRLAGGGVQLAHERQRVLAHADAG